MDDKSGTSWKREQITAFVIGGMLLMLAITLVSILGYLAGQLKTGAAASPLPVPIWPTGVADYSAEVTPLIVQEVNLDLLSSVLQDDQVANEKLPARLARLAIAFQEPVPTATRSTFAGSSRAMTAYNLSQTVAAITSLAPTPVDTSTPLPSSTRTITTTPTRTPTPSATRTATPAQMPTRTQTPTITLENSLTPQVDTPTPSLTPPDCTVIDPGTTVLSASADTYLTAASGRANTNFGNSNTLVLRGAPNESYSLLRFDLSGQPQDFQTDGATVYIFLQNAAPSIDLRIYQIEDDWAEMNVTWNSAPILAQTSTAELTVPGIANCLLSIDLPASFVQGWIDGSILN